MPIDTVRIEAAVAEILAAIGEDPARPGLIDTPARVAKTYSEFFAGLGADPLDELADAMPTTAAERGELVVLRDIAFRSVCEHHLLPFTGVVHLAYVPDQRIVGLGKLPRVVGVLSSRPQLQERLTEQIADALDAALAPLGVLVVLDATHGCVTSRGERQPNSTTVTLASRGSLRDTAARTEVMTLIGARS